MVLLYFWYWAQFRIFNLFHKAVNDIDPAALARPVQIATSNKDPIVFTRDGYNYVLHPLYDYKLNGLVLHDFIYDRWFSLSRTDKTFTKDLCVIWGRNLETKSYQDPTFEVRQDFRFCLYNWMKRNFVFNGDELSNNHTISK